MLNQVVLVGRLTSDPEKMEVEKRKECIITLAVPRSFKNENGEYETDFIDCVLYNGVAESTTEFCKKGDLVGIKGRLQKNYTLNNKYQLCVIAEKVTFLSSKNTNN